MDPAGTFSLQMNVLKVLSFFCFCLTYVFQVDLTLTQFPLIEVSKKKRVPINTLWKFWNNLSFRAISYYFWKRSFRFIEELGGSYRDFLNAPCPHTRITSPSTSPTQVAYLLQLTNLQWHFIVTHTSFCTRVHSGIWTRCMFSGFGQMWNDLHSPSRYPAEWFYCPENSVFHLFIPSAPGNHWFFFLSFYFCLFQNVIELES